MATPIMELRLFRAHPASGWDFIVKERGELLAASGGDEHFERIADAFKAALLATQAVVKERRDRIEEGEG